MSHQLEQNKIDGDKTILHSLTEAQSKEHDTFAFGLHEVREFPCTDLWFNFVILGVWCGRVS